MKTYKYIICTLVILITEIACGELIVPGGSLFNWNNDNYTIFGGSTTGLLGSTLEVKVDTSSPPVQLHSESSTLTPGNIWFELTLDSKFDANYVLNSDTAFHNGYHDAFEHLKIELISINNPNPFYIGFWISDGYTPKDGDIYGWVQLSYDGTTLHLLDSAAENSGAGIIAGRYEVVPEPSSVLLLGVGAGGILFYRRSKRRQQEQQISRRNFK